MSFFAAPESGAAEGVVSGGEGRAGLTAAASDGDGARSGGVPFFGGEQEIAAAVFAEMEVVRFREGGDDAGGNAQVAAGADAVMDQGDRFAALADKPEEMGENGRGNVGAQLLEQGLALRRSGRKREEFLLSGEKGFDEVSHTGLVSHDACPRRRGAKNRLRTGELAKFSGHTGRLV